MFLTLSIKVAIEIPECISAAHLNSSVYEYYSGQPCTPEAERVAKLFDEKRTSDPDYQAALDTLALAAAHYFSKRPDGHVYLSPMSGPIEPFEVDKEELTNGG